MDDIYLTLTALLGSVLLFFIGFLFGVDFYSPPDRPSFYEQVDSQTSKVRVITNKEKKIFYLFFENGKEVLMEKKN